MQIQDGKCHQSRKYKIKIENVIKVENTTSSQKMSSRRRKCNTKIGNVIKVENAMHQSRKCKFNMENDIKVENTTSRWKMLYIKIGNATSR